MSTDKITPDKDGKDMPGGSGQQEANPGGAAPQEPAEAKYEVTLQEMKDVMGPCKGKLRTQQEPVDEMRWILTLLKEVRSDQQGVLGDKDAMRTYFFGDGLQGFAKALMTQARQTKFTKDEFTEQVKQLPALLASVLVANLDNVDLVDGMKCVFDHKSRLYQQHILVEENAILIDNSGDRLPEEEREWRSKIDVGTELDGIKIDPDHGVKCWSRCSVKAKGAEGRITVAFANEGIKADRVLSVYSPEIAGPGTHAVDDAEWRQALEVNGHVDAYDSTGVWYASTVLARETRQLEGREVPFIQLALRVAHPEGDKTDTDGNKFFGWEELHDEWFQLYTARIARYQTHTDDSLSTQTAAAQNAHGEATSASAGKTHDVDDSMDLLVTQHNGQDIFAVHRKACRSDLLIDFINAFGRLGGFRIILERFQADSGDANDLGPLVGLVDCIAKAAPVYHKQFVANYFEPLEKAVRERILRAKIAQLRTVGGKKFEEILEALYKHLLPRITSRDAASLDRDRNLVTLEIAQLFLSVDFLERRIDGVKLVRDVCFSCSRMLQPSTSTTVVSATQASAQQRKLEMVDQVVAKVTQGGWALVQIFSKERTHVQLVQRSEQILRLLMAKEALTEADRQLVWDAGEINDGELKPDLHKVLVGAAADMKSRDREVFIGKIEQISAEELIDRHIQLVTEMCTTIREPENEEHVIKKGLELLWRVAIESGPDIKLLMVNRAALGFSDIIKRQNMAQKLEYVDKLAESLRNNTMGHLVIKMVIGLLKNTFTEPSGHPEIENVADMIDYLETKHQFFAAVIDNFKDYMTRVRAEVESNWVGTKEDLDSKVLADKFMHSDQLTERLEFIRYYANSSKKVRVSAGGLDTLWDVLVTKSPIENDSKLMYEWLRAVCDQIGRAYREVEPGDTEALAARTSQAVVSSDDLIQFYENRLEAWGQGDDEFRSLSLQGFHCMQSFFVLINEIRGKLRKINRDSGVYQGKARREAEAPVTLEASGTTKKGATGTTTTTTTEKSGQPATKFTSFNNQTGASYTSYSFDKDKKDKADGEKQTATTSTGTGTDAAKPIGPEPKPTTPKKTTTTTAAAEDPEDLEIQSLVPPSQLDGAQILWQVATESTGKQVVESAAKLLVQMHHEVKPELRPQLPSFDDMFIDHCFAVMEAQRPAIERRTEQEVKALNDAFAALPQTATTIQKLRALPPQERKIVRAIFLLRQFIRASEKDGTHALRPHASLCKGEWFGSIQVQNNVCRGEGYRMRFEVGLDSHATVWDLKKLIGEEVVKRTFDGQKTYDYAPDPDAPAGSPNVKPVHPATIAFFKLADTTDVKDQRNGDTLKELQFKHNQQIGCRRKTQFAHRKAPILEDNPETHEAELTFQARQVLDAIFDRFAVDVEGQKVLTKEGCVEFTKECTGEQSSLEDPRVTKFMDKHDPDGTGSVGRAQFHKFFVDSCLFGKDDTLRENLRKLGYAPDLSKLPVPGDPDSILQARAGKEEMPRYKIVMNEKWFDSLMGLLGVHDEVARCVRELIQMLATNPILHNKVLALDREDSQKAFAWSDIFDASNVHKMLYSLEIVEAILVDDTDEQRTHAWVKRFLELNGLEELQTQLRAALASVSGTAAGDRKKCVDQLLKLIRIFVMTARGDPQGTTGAANEQAAQVAPQEVESVPPAKEQADQEGDDSQYTTPKKQIKHPPEAASTFDGEPEITKEFLFGDGDAGDQEKAPKEAKDTKEKSDGREAFEHLRRVLQIDDLGKQVVQRIDVRSLQDQVVQVATLFLRGEEIKADDRLIVESAMSLWATLLSDPSKALGERDQSSLLSAEFVTDGLLSCKDGKVRECFRNSFKQICTAQVALQKEVLEILLVELKDAGRHGKQGKEYFGLYKDLVAIRINGEQLESSGPEEDIVVRSFRQAIETLKSHQSKEKRSSWLTDQVLQGLLELLSAILAEAKKHQGLRAPIVEAWRQGELAQEVLYQCLFFQPGKSDVGQLDQPALTKAKSSSVTDATRHGLPEQAEGSATTKCRTEASRKSGFKVVHEYLHYLEPHEMVEFLEGCIMPLIKDVERPKKWRYAPNAKGRQNYLGIVNLGCICYMISMLQQFFMVPQFRYQLLKAVDTSPPAMAEYKDEEVDDNLLRQLQKLFGFLELSERHAFNPRDLCFAFKDLDGSPTRIGEQKDSQEFLNIFFDRIESLLRPTSQRDLLKDVFAGNQCSQLICQSCGKVKNKLELFYNLSLQVKGSSGIYDSLGGLVKGQTIEDYRCDGCDKKVNVVRRSLLADMPNVLIVHLQRIVFSFDTLANDKVNSRFEFPNVLDLKEFSFKENVQGDVEDELQELKQISDDDYVYRLVGVNVHVGTADHGHYYSIIHTKRGSEEPRPDVDEAEWRKIDPECWKVFDDSNVKHFAVRDLEKEAFGGDQSDNAKAGSGDALTDDQLASFLASGAQTYGKSAYMLIYERKSKKNLSELSGGSIEKLGAPIAEKKKDDAIDSSAPANAEAANDSAEPEVRHEIDFRQVEKYMPEWITALTGADNKHFLVDSQLYNGLFFDMVKQIYKVIGQEMVISSHRYDYHYQVNFRRLKQASLEVASKLVYDMLAYFDANTQLSDMSTHISTILTFSDSAYSLKRGESSLVVEFVKRTYLADSCAHFFKIMFACTDVTSRNWIGRITAAAISRLFRLYAECDPESRSSVETVKDVYTTLDSFMDHCMRALEDKECHRNWTRLECYFKMLLEIATSCTTAAQWLLERSDVIADLVDFMLGNKSPRAVAGGGTRTAMGGTVPPPFQPLYTLVAFLVRMTHTADMDLEIRLNTHADPKRVSDYEGHKTYFLSEEAWTMLSKTEFLQKVLFDNKYDDNSEFANALAHLCYKNLAFTRKVTKKLLKSISYSNNDGVQRHLAVVERIAEIKDDFQIQRLEYLFGFGYLMHCEGSDGKIPQYGAPVAQQTGFKSDVYLILSGLDAKVHDDALLNALWKHKGALDSFTLACLQSLCGLLAKDEAIAEYFSVLPAYNYLTGRYTDWIRPYLEKQLADARKWNNGSGTQEKQDKIVRVTSLFEKYEAFLERKLLQAAGASPDQEGAGEAAARPESSQETFIRCAPQPYVILEALEERVVHTQDIDGAIELSVTQVSCAWAESRPTRTGNLSLPSTEAQPEAAAKQASEAKADDQKQDNATTSAAQPPDQSRDSQPAPNSGGAEAEAQQSAAKSVCEDLLYRFTVKNLGDSAVKMRISFRPKCPEGDVNLVWPRGGVKDFLKAGATSHLLTLRKRDPTAASGEPETAKLGIEVQCKARSATDFTMGTYASQGGSKSGAGAATGAAGSKDAAGGQGKANQAVQAQRRNAIIPESGATPAPESQSKKQEGSTQAEGQGAGATAQAAGPQASGADSYVQAAASDLPQAQAGMKACPVCTVLQPASNRECECCTTPF